MGEKNDLLSPVASDDVVDRIEHLVEYLSCRVFGQAMYRHVTAFVIKASWSPHYLRSSDQEIDCAGALNSFGYLIDFLV